MHSPTPVQEALSHLRATTGRTDLVQVVTDHIRDLREQVSILTAKNEALEAELAKAYEVAARRAARSLWARLVRWFNHSPKGGSLG